MIKAKFKIQSLKIVDGLVKQPNGSYADGKVVNISGAPETVSPENDKIFTGSSTGIIQLMNVNPASIGDLKEGDEVFVTVEKAIAPVKTT